MIGRMINLPFKVLGAVSRKLQERNDAAVEARYGKGTATDDYDDFNDKDALGEKLPDDFDPGSIDLDPGRVLSDQRAGRAPMFVDVRKPAAYRARHVPGALNMPLGTVHIRLAELPPDQRVVVYCDDGRKSREAATFLRFRGLEDTWMLTGGFNAWTRAGGAVEGGAR